MSLLLSLIALPSLDPAATREGIPAWERPEILKVECLGSVGTAFRVGPTTAVSVDHVTKGKGCFIGRQTFKVLEKKGDFSILQLPTPAISWLHIDCGGFIPGRRYEAWGYARGRDTLTSVDITAIPKRYGAFSVLNGVFTIIPGQSGGPIFDQLTRKVTGTNNVFDARGGESGSIALKDTSLCRG